MVTSLRPVGACVPLAGVAAAAEVDGDDPDEEVDDDEASEMLPISVLTFTWQFEVNNNGNRPSCTAGVYDHIQLCRPEREKGNPG